MSENQSTVEIQILGKPYQVECSSDERENLIKATSYLETQIRLLQRKSNDTIAGERLLTITALNLANDLLTVRRASSENEETLNRHIREISTKLIQKINRSSSTHASPAGKSFGATLGCT